MLTKVSCVMAGFFCCCLGDYKKTKLWIIVCVVFIQLQRPATSVLRLPLYDKSTSNRIRSSCFLYLSRCAPVHTSLNGRLRFCSFLGSRFSFKFIQLHLLETRETSTPPSEANNASFVGVSEVQDVQVPTPPQDVAF